MTPTDPLAESIAAYRWEQLRCAAAYPDPGARLGLFHWFTEEMIMIQETHGALAVDTSPPIRPYYEHAGITIYHGDCREILPGLEFGSIVSDPPYGVGKDYGQIDDTLETFQAAVSMIANSGKPSALFLAVKRIFDLPVKPQWIAVWSKTYGASGFIAYPIYPHWEPIALYNFSGNYSGNNGHRSDVFEFVPAKAKGSGHPTPKPVDLMVALLNWFPAEPVLDPFMGSGTTLVAAKNLGRRAIGIEIEEKYCEIAAKRLAQEVLF